MDKIKLNFLKKILSKIKFSILNFKFSNFKPPSVGIEVEFEVEI